VKDTETKVDKTLKEVKKSDNTNNTGATANMTIDEIKESIQVLTVQLQDHLQKADQHRTMATKAQGALEVLTQIIQLKEPKTETSEG